MICLPSKQVVDFSLQFAEFVLEQCDFQLPDDGGLAERALFGRLLRRLGFIGFERCFVETVNIPKLLRSAELDATHLNNTYAF